MKASSIFLFLLASTALLAQNREYEVDGQLDATVTVWNENLSATIHGDAARVIYLNLLKQDPGQLEVDFHYTCRGVLYSWKGNRQFFCQNRVSGEKMNIECYFAVNLKSGELTEPQGVRFKSCILPSIAGVTSGLGESSQEELDNLTEYVSEMSLDDIMSSLDHYLNPKPGLPLCE